MSVKTQFSIKDLENLSGVKAHTIRIWEKRYQLLEPNRTETNIRQYDLLNLKKLLNVTFLYNEGYKISKIAKFKEEEIAKLIQDISQTQKESYGIKTFKTAMFSFDYALFSNAYDELRKKMDFREVFYAVFIPLLDDIGMLWQTGTIDPSHERFISEAIKQKIILNIHEIQQKNLHKSSLTFALYLPYEEIHEIGLLFANFEILSAGFNSVYLGNNIPMDSLKHLLKHYPDIIFLSYFTVKPDKESVSEYVDRFHTEIGNSKIHLWLMGSKVVNLKPNEVPKKTKIIKSLKELQKELKDKRLK